MEEGWSMLLERRVDAEVGGVNADIRGVDANVRGLDDNVKSE